MGIVCTIAYTEIVHRSLAHKISTIVIGCSFGIISHVVFVEPIPINIIILAGLTPYMLNIEVAYVQSFCESRMLLKPFLYMSTFCIRDRRRRSVVGILSWVIREIRHIRFDASTARIVTLSTSSCCRNFGITKSPILIRIGSSIELFKILCELGFFGFF